MSVSQPDNQVLDQTLCNGAFTNYVDKILPIIDLTTYPPTVAICEGILFNEMRENRHTVDISGTTYLNRRNAP